MLDSPFASALGLALGFSIGVFYGRTTAIKEVWKKVEARLRALNDTHTISVAKADGTPLTLEEFVGELKA